MGAYLIKFTPLEPYFFGNEKNFGYGLRKNKTYFIESNEVPEQSKAPTLGNILIKNNTSVISTSKV